MLSAVLVGGLIGTSILMTGGTTAAIAVVVMAGLVAIALERPFWILFVTLFTGGISLGAFFGFGRGIFESLGGVNFDGVRLVGITVGLLIAVTMSARGWRSRGAMALYLAFLAYGAVSLGRSASPMDGLRLLTKILLPFLVYTVIANSGSEANSRRIERVVLAGGVLVVCISVVQLIFGLAQWTPENSVTRFVGPTGGAAPTAAYTGLLTVFAISQWIARHRVTYLALGAAFGTVLLLTVARTELMGTLLGIATIAVASRRPKLLGAIAIVAITVAVTYAPLRERMFRLEASSLADIAASPVTTVINTQGREVLWPATVAFWLRRPWVGGGLGSTFPYLDTINAGQNVPHNEYLRVLAELGVIGLALFVSMYMLKLRTSWIRARSRPLQERGPHLAALGGLVFFLAICAFDNGLDWYMSAGIFVWAFCGLSAAAVPERDPVGSATAGAG